MRGFVRGQPSANHGLHFAGTGAALHGDLQLPQGRTIPPSGSAQCLVKGHDILLSIAVAQDEALAVVVDAD